jgi:hypothetical protein
MNEACAKLMMFITPKMMASPRLARSRKLKLVSSW